MVSPRKRALFRHPNSQLFGGGGRGKVNRLRVRAEHEVYPLHSQNVVAFQLEIRIAGVIPMNRDLLGC